MTDQELFEFGYSAYVSGIKLTSIPANILPYKQTWAGWYAARRNRKAVYQ